MDIIQTSDWTAKFPIFQKQVIIVSQSNEVHPIKRKSSKMTVTRQIDKCENKSLRTIALHQQQISQLIFHTPREINSYIHW